MNQVSGTYYIWIGGSCDYGHKERAGAAAAIIELDVHFREIIVGEYGYLLWLV